ncbi:MAG: hypothetical protein S4CHLAM45_11690 [Chlamydiales bacterium]|nr:hypothetical protein [Chlamydiales bacterium]MCH9619661.1 hypothetical protein [Chlamydiales bacterium]MCH9623267.1 hypothetical protein [Chlamydiales bacterium]
MVAQFFVQEGTLAGLLLVLDEGESWTVGRDPEQCNLLLDEPAIDRKQLLCRKVEEGYTLQNLSEGVEVLLNGDPLVEEHPLVDGDLIVIGTTTLQFNSGEKPAVEVESEFVQSAEDKIIMESLEGNEELDEEEAIESFDPSDESIEEEDVFDEPLEETEAEEDEVETPHSIDEEAPPIEEEMQAFHVDLTATDRFILKVIAGPNTGAEFSIDMGKEYLIGTDSNTCDIVFHDLSVSREHARLMLDEQGVATIDDLGSRNGVLVDQKKIMELERLASNSIITVGTTSFFLIDREAPQETIATPIFEPVRAEVEEEVEEEEVEEEAVEKEKEPSHASGAFILGVIVIGFAALFGLGIFSLMTPKEVKVPETNYSARLYDALKDFPEVNYSYNPTTHKLFLVGHVEGGVRLNELHYNLQGLPFIKGIDDNIVDDEAVWQEMNIILSKHANFKGVSMHSPVPGEFVLSGYLKTEAQASLLNDYMNIHFNYLANLVNRVVVEEQINEMVVNRLQQEGFGSVKGEFSSGELTLTGYLGSTQSFDFDYFLKELSHTNGIRKILNYVVLVSPEQQVIDLNVRYPGRYKITGYSKHGDVNFNVVINGKILTRGDALDGMTITSIQPHTIFLEMEGLKYKIDYNK